MTESDQKKLQRKEENQSAAAAVEIPTPRALAERGLPHPSAAEGRPSEIESPVLDHAGGSSTEGWPERSRFAQDVHVYLREYIRLADQKATFFFAGGTALLAFLYDKGAVDRWMKPIMEWNVLDVIALAAVASLMVSVLLAVWVVIPRTPGSRRGRIFWEAIAEYRSAREYADDLMTLSEASLIRTRAEHCWDLAAVCRTKYMVLRVALRAGFIGLAAALIMFLFL